MSREKRIEEGIRVTMRYKDFTGESCQTQWTLNPLLFEVGKPDRDLRHERPRGGCREAP